MGSWVMRTVSKNGRRNGCEKPHFSKYKKWGNLVFSNTKPEFPFSLRKRQPLYTHFACSPLELFALWIGDGDDGLTVHHVTDFRERSDVAPGLPEGPLCDLLEHLGMFRHNFSQGLQDRLGFRSSTWIRAFSRSELRSLPNARVVRAHHAVLRLFSGVRDLRVCAIARH